MRRHRKAYLIIVGCCVSAYIFNWIVTPRLIRETRLEVAFRPRLQEPLDIKGWKNQVSLSRKRYAMANYIVRQRLLVGSSAAEVRAILGEPAFKQENRLQSTVGWAYVLVKQKDIPAKTWLLWPDLAGNFESWALEVAFDASERMVTSCRIFVP